MIDILDQLDRKTHTGEELQQNYLQLVEKWGEWELVCGDGASGIVIRYVDVGNALFSGLGITFLVLTFVSLITGVALGKIVFPLLDRHYTSTNDELVDIATLKSATKIDELSKKSKKEWF